jgi:hypothetical protein
LVSNKNALQAAAARPAVGPCHLVFSIRAYSAFLCVGDEIEKFLRGLSKFHCPSFV